MIVFVRADKLDLSAFEGRDFTIFNLTSVKEGFPRLNLIPPFDIFSLDEKQFDMQYMQYIFNYQSVFVDFMSIIMGLYYSKDIILLTAPNQNFDYVVDSLQKLIQQRYGIDSGIVNEYEDYEYLEESKFSTQGLYNLDIDKETFTYLYYNLYPNELQQKKQ